MYKMTHKENERLKYFERLILLLAGISIPLIRIRLDLPVLSLSVYMISIVLLFVYNSKSILKNFRFQEHELPIFLFLFITLFSCLYSLDITYGLMRWTKLLLAVILYIGMKSLFISKPHYIQIIMRIASCALAIYFLYLMYYYLIKFNLSYIGPITKYATRSGKNSLSFMTAFVVPFTLVWILQKPYSIKSIRTLVTLITLIGAILIQSRGLYILLIYYCINIIIRNKINMKGIGKFFIITILLLLIISQFAPTYLISDLQYRAKSILFVFDDNYRNSNDTSSSISHRSSLMNKGFNMFKENPFIGAGLGSFVFYEDDAFISHNDYVLVLSEQGIIGFLIFVLLIYKFLKVSYEGYKHDKDNLNVFLAMSGLSFYLLLINAYDNIFLWTTMSMISSISVNIRSSISREKNREMRTLK